MPTDPQIQELFTDFLFFLPLPTDWEFLVDEKKFCLQNLILFFIFDRPTASKRFEKNLPTYKSTDHGLIIVQKIKATRGGLNANFHISC